MKTIVSIILLVLGVLLVASRIASCELRTSVGLAPEYGVDCVGLLLGGLMIWGAVALWRSRSSNIEKNENRRRHSAKKAGNP